MGTAAAGPGPVPEPKEEPPTHRRRVEEPRRLLEATTAEPEQPGAVEEHVPATSSGGSVWHRLQDADAELLRAGARVHVMLGSPKGRYVSILRTKGRLWAVDSVCYHAGGPLGAGDIEEVGDQGRPCVRCPWHHYLIDLETGTKWHQPLKKDASGKLVPDGWRTSDKIVQRAHDVDERPDGIFVRLRLEGACESDFWAQREDCFKAVTELARGGPGNRGAGAHGSDGRLPAPSGFVLQGGSSKPSSLRSGMLPPRIPKLPPQFKP